MDEGVGRTKMVLHLACNPAENKGRRVVTLCQTPLKANGILEFSKFLWKIGAAAC